MYNPVAREKIHTHLREVHLEECNSLVLYHWARNEVTNLMVYVAKEKRRNEKSKDTIIKKFDLFFIIRF